MHYHRLITECPQCPRLLTASTRHCANEVRLDRCRFFHALCCIEFLPSTVGCPGLQTSCPGEQQSLTHVGLLCPSPQAARSIVLSCSLGWLLSFNIAFARRGLF